MRSGGCQCGAVRFRAGSLVDNAHVCHCRMCQKAVGNFFAALVGVPDADLSWTRGQPATWESSDGVDRGFCGICGTPLFYHNRAAGHVSLCIATFDDPADIALAFQCGAEGLLPQVAQLVTVQGTGTTEEDMIDKVAGIAASNRQHPDYDTESRPI